MTSAEPSGHDTPYDTALCAALTTEHSVIYGYGIVSAHCQPDANSLVSFALNQHRQRRDQVIAMLAARSVSAPVAAAGYQLPMPVNNPTLPARPSQPSWRMRFMISRSSIFRWSK